MDWPNHTRPWREWRDAIAGQRMHHGWILAGKAGLGKREFALSAARELVAEAGVPQPNGDHPDIIVLTHLPKDDKEEKKKQDGKPYQIKRNIAVAQIRAMQQRLTTRPTLGSRRVIIIDPADDLETSASNALLKSLEEPPKGTFFILVAHRPSRLLPTIRSRCRILRFEALKDDIIMPFDEKAFRFFIKGDIRYQKNYETFLILLICRLRQHYVLRWKIARFVLRTLGSQPMRIIASLFPRSFYDALVRAIK